MTSAYVAGAFGLVGALLGGLIAGVSSLRVAREARTTAERAWIRDSRRGVYDRYLTSGQRLLIACEALKASLDGTAGAATDSVAAAQESVAAAHVDLFEVYGVVQTVAQRPVVDAARDYGYRLLALKNILDSSPGALEIAQFGRVAELVRHARHATIDAMRDELGLPGSAQPPADYNPFADTDLKDVWAPAR